MRKPRLAISRMERRHHNWQRGERGRKRGRKKVGETGIQTQTERKPLLVSEQSILTLLFETMQ